jgi:hypothetical protein
MINSEGQDARTEKCGEMLILQTVIDGPVWKVLEVKEALETVGAKNREAQA